MRNQMKATNSSNWPRQYTELSSSTICPKSRLHGRAEKLVGTSGSSYRPAGRGGRAARFSSIAAADYAPIDVATAMLALLPQQSDIGRVCRTKKKLTKRCRQRRCCWQGCPMWACRTCCSGEGGEGMCTSNCQWAQHNGVRRMRPTCKASRTRTAAWLPSPASCPAHLRRLKTEGRKPRSLMPCSW